LRHRAAFDLAQARLRMGHPEDLPFREKNIIFNRKG
jgi:hypothetical protein